MLFSARLNVGCAILLLASFLNLFITKPCCPLSAPVDSEIILCDSVAHHFYGFAVSLFFDFDGSLEHEGFPLFAAFVGMYEDDALAVVFVCVFSVMIVIFSCFGDSRDRRCSSQICSSRAMLL